MNHRKGERHPEKATAALSCTKNNVRKRCCTVKQVNRTRAISLCAVMTAFALILLSVPAFPVQANGGDPKSDGYKYAVTIEFGSMTFAYDYGKWDVNEMRYKANAASKNPANGTTEGYPGWYGFDGTANRIGVKYSNENETDPPEKKRKLAVTLSYRALTSAEASTEGIEVGGVEMKFYSDAALTVPLSSTTFTVPHTDPEDKDAKTVIYASLRGEPTVNGNKFQSDSFVPVGMLTIRVGEISD